jgi:hypothetical protein
MKFFLTALFLCSTGFSATLECETLINLEPVVSGSVTTVKNSKLQVSHHPDAIAFVTETGPENFLVEAFLPSLQMRIYAEGALRTTNEKLTASAWSREFMVDVTCKLK